MGKDCMAGDMYGFSVRSKKHLNFQKVRNDIETAIK